MDAECALCIVSRRRIGRGSEPHHSGLCTSYGQLRNPPPPPPSPATLCSTAPRHSLLILLDLIGFILYFNLLYSLSSVRFICTDITITYLQPTNAAPDALPKPLLGWDSLRVPPALRVAVAKLGFATLTAIQRESMPLALQVRSCSYAMRGGDTHSAVSRRGVSTCLCVCVYVCLCLFAVIKRDNECIRVVTSSVSHAPARVRAV